MSNKIIINCDGGSRGNPGIAACAFVVSEPEGNEIYSHGYKLGKTTNNQAEYQAVVHSLNWLETNTDLISKLSVIEYKLDSLLVVKQINKEFKIKDINLLNVNTLIQNKLLKIKNLYPNLKIIFNHIPRENNSSADMLVNKTLDN